MQNYRDKQAEEEMSSASESDLEDLTPPMGSQGQTLQAPVTVSSSQEKKYNYSPRFNPPMSNGGGRMHMNMPMNMNINVDSSVMSTRNPLNTISAPSRTVYLGNTPPNMSIETLLDHVSSGVIEDCKILMDKNCAFITFLDEKSALLFHSDSILKRLNINGNDIKIGWGKTNLMDPLVATRIKYETVTRNVYIGNLIKGEENIVAKLKDDFVTFGTIDCINYLPEKGIAFIHFSSILSAIHAVDKIRDLNESYRNKKIHFGKDRCAYITKLQQYNAAQFLGINTDDLSSVKQLNDRDFITNTLLQQSAATAAIATSAGGPNNLGNRTIFLGNLPRITKIEDICNVVRGGILQSIKLIPDKNICFITFIDPTAAAQFYAMTSLHGLIIHKRRCKIGWGKHSGPLSNKIYAAVSHGASRNIYLGNLQWNESNILINEDYLRHIFSQYGEVEQINYLPERNCCFINFTNINNALTAMEKIEKNPEFQDLKINFGKDRCGNIPHQIH